MNKFRELLIGYIEENLQPKTISYFHDASGYKAHMTNGVERLEKTPEKIADDIIDLQLEARAGRKILRMGG